MYQHILFIAIFLPSSGAAYYFGIAPYLPHKTCPTFRCTTCLSASLQQAEKRTPPKEVTSMFNDFADSFDDKLVNILNYTAPTRLAEAASQRVQTEARQGRLYRSALDAGCGTGLMGPPLRKIVKGPLVGADLSPKMIERASELVVDDELSDRPRYKGGIRRCSKEVKMALNCKQIYDGLFIADLLDLSGTVETIPDFDNKMKKVPEQFDLIASADVLCYFGTMDQILNEFTKRLAPGGDIIFSTETLKAGDYNWVMTESERFAHNPAYVAKIAIDAGLVVVSQTAFTPRLESGEDVLGTIHMFHKPL